MNPGGFGSLKWDSFRLIDRLISIVGRKSLKMTIFFLSGLLWNGARAHLSLCKLTRHQLRDGDVGVDAEAAVR